MHPRSAIYTFLLAVGGMLLVALLSSGAKDSEAAAESAVQCTLGSCPVVITPEDNGRTMNYPLNATITFIPEVAERPTLSCSPHGALEPLAFRDPAEPNALEFRAQKRGTCILQSASTSIVLNISRFR